jgi:ADP-ribosylglycohydrolase
VEFIDRVEPMTTERERAIVNSALWAAVGDALGWITELTNEGGVKARAGVSLVTAPVAWRRIIGGRSGTKIPLPAGTYSDDTQLRLSVCRAIRGNGIFDAEAFARVEVTAWQGYALGAGLGTKAAAANLTKRGVNWFSNFFNTRTQLYSNAGGNGAAMRVQPHVWVSKAGDKKFVLPVMRDSLTTHGHPHGFCGAVFHALALSDALDEGTVSSPSRWYDYLRTFSDLPSIVDQDRQLEAFWKPAWEQVSGHSLVNAIEVARSEARRDLDEISRILTDGDLNSYVAVLKALGCLDEKYRGSGLKTAIAASALAWLYREKPIEAALIAAANVLGSDTDTIATMAGAILGATAAAAPDWPLQDREYIKTEAIRLAAIGRGEVRDSFAYPDLSRWQPPATQSDAVGLSSTGFAIAGLGEAEPQGEEYKMGDSVWQWLKLSFGQTVLGKRRTVMRQLIGIEDLPVGRRPARPLVEAAKNQQTLPELNLVPPAREDEIRDPAKNKSFDDRKVDENRNIGRQTRSPEDINGWTDRVIQSDFEDLLLGRLLNRCIDQLGSIEGAVSFAAIVAKAKIARRRRERIR